MKAKHARRIRFGIEMARSALRMGPALGMPFAMLFIASWGSETLERRGFEHVILRDARGAS